MTKALIFGILVFCVNAAFASDALKAEKESFRSIRHGDKVYVDSEQVASAIRDLQREIRILSRKIDAIERGHVGSENHDSLNSDHNHWICIISPTFEDKSFMSKGATKTEATFKVVERCLDAGVDSFYCNKKNAECTNQ